MGGDARTDADNSADGDEEALTVLQKVAILMVAIGQDASGQVLKFLSDYEIEEVTQAVADLKTVSPKLIDLVLEDFENFLLAGEYLSQGGADFAREILERAVGPRKAQEILERVNTKVSSGFYILKNVAPQQIAPFISNEHPQTIALILSQLEPDQAAGILSHLSERIQAEVAYRIAAMENITPNVLKQIEESLEASLRDILGGNQDVGGPKVVADILNLTGSSVEKSVLDLMDSTDPEVAEEVRNLMFVFSDLVKLTDKEIQVLLREVRSERPDDRPQERGGGAQGEGPGQHAGARAAVHPGGDGLPGSDAAQRGGGSAAAYRPAGEAARGAGSDHHYTG